MKRVRAIKNFGLWAKKGEIYDISDNLARSLSNPRRRHEGQVLEIIEDLGTHIGRSKHTYNRNGRSEAYG